MSLALAWLQSSDRVSALPHHHVNLCLMVMDYPRLRRTCSAPNLAAAPANLACVSRRSACGSSPSTARAHG